MDGFGFLSTDRGEDHTGYFKNDQKHGFGLQKQRNGIICQGYWLNDKKHGPFKEYNTKTGLSKFYIFESDH